MAKIKQLSPLEAQKIAAGEVVERPANVVKELIENSIDAGATTLSVYVEDGGKQLIRVIDNGCGMSPEDARLSLLHHATSKITTVDDLATLSTYGFRGEALSSIASVSKVTLITKEQDAPTATKLEIMQGTIEQESTVAANTGTDITVQDLFFALPARRKFLKTKETEWRSIVHLFHAFALTYRSISFTLYHEGRLIYTLPITQSLSERISQLFEPALSRNTLVIEADEERMSLSVKGAIVDRSYNRFDRNHIFVFVNNRWIKNHKLVQSLIKGYQGMLQPQRYPAGFLFITIDPTYIDVNIHPRKEEVQFLHPRMVEELIETTVKARLEKKQDEQLGARSNYVPARILSEPAPKNTLPESRQLVHVIQETPTVPQQSIVEKQHFSAILDATFTTESTMQPSSTKEVQENVPLEQPLFQYRLIGQLHTTYILLETQQALVLIDQHAAHERILYERLKHQFHDIARVRLLFPTLVPLNKNDIDLLEPYLDVIHEFGVEAARMSDHEIIITETPVFLKNQPLDDIIKQTIGILHEHNYLDKNKLKKIIHEKMHALLSCKAAVKAGDILSLESMQEIIKDLSATDNKLICPHGRPTLWEVSSSDIQKKFKRDYRSN